MTWMIEIKNKLPRVLSCFFEDSKHLRAHLYYRPVVLQLGSLPKDRQKIPFQPSINSGSLHWNDVQYSIGFVFCLLFLKYRL